jgi:hypothetical protein
MARPAWLRRQGLNQTLHQVNPRKTKKGCTTPLEGVARGHPRRRAPFRRHLPRSGPALCLGPIGLSKHDAPRLAGGRCGPQAQDPADRTTAAGSRPGAEYGIRHGDNDPKAPERKSLPRPADRASLRRNARPPPRRPWLPPPLPSPQHQLGRSNLAWLVDKKTLYTVQWVFAPTIAKSTRAFRSSTSGQTEDLL